MGKTRTFDTGATRDTDEGKLDPEGFISPLVLYRFSSYMDKHRAQSDGEFRDSDNWQKGMPQDEYMKSLIRHVFDAWMIHREEDAAKYEFSPGTETYQEVLCAILFNVQGLLLETMREWGAD